MGRKKSAAKALQQARLRRLWFYLAGVAVVAAVGVGLVLYGRAGAGAVHLAAGVEWPDYVRQGPALVRETYQFALERPDVLTYMPCYCGCGSHGDKNNLDCFIDQRKPTGEVVFDPHAST